MAWDIVLLEYDVDSEKSLKKVIFSDETKIEIGNNRKVYAWRKVDDRFRPECNGKLQNEILCHILRLSNVIYSSLNFCFYNFPHIFYHI
jgi:hypothetical protein